MGHRRTGPCPSPEGNTRILGTQPPLVQKPFVSVVTSKVPSYGSQKRLEEQIPWGRNEATVGAGAASASMATSPPHSALLARDMRAGLGGGLCFSFPTWDITRLEGSGLKLRREGTETWVQLLRTAWRDFREREAPPQNCVRAA